jgi:hypothetical protein
MRENILSIGHWILQHLILVSFRICRMDKFTVLSFLFVDCFQNVYFHIIVIQFVDMIKLEKLVHHHESYNMAQL